MSERKYVVLIDGGCGRFHKTVDAATAAKAKYATWLEFRDAYDYSFFEFLRITKCWSLSPQKGETLNE